MPPSLPTTSVAPPSGFGIHSEACWSGCVVLFACVGSPAVVGQAGGSALRNRHVVPEKYGPTTLNCVGPFIGWPESLSCQPSSTPNTSRVGTPAAVWRVGSGAICWLYQACTPGQ